MPKYYTRVCNFYYGSISKILVKKKVSLPLNGNNEISFDQIEIITRNSKKKISIHKLSKLSKFLKKKVIADLKILPSLHLTDDLDKHDISLIDTIQREDSHISEEAM